MYGKTLSALNSPDNLSNLLAALGFAGRELFRYIDCVAEATPQSVEKRLERQLLRNTAPFRWCPPWRNNPSGPATGPLSHLRRGTGAGSFCYRNKGRKGTFSAGALEGVPDAAAYRKSEEGVFMNVQFPGLGFSVDVNPVVFEIGGLSVHWYGVIIASGFLLAVIYALTSAKKFFLNSDKLFDAVLLGVVTGIVGARLYYVLFYPTVNGPNPYFQDPVKILYIWEEDSPSTAASSADCSAAF